MLLPGWGHESGRKEVDALMKTRWFTVQSLSAVIFIAIALSGCGSSEPAIKDNGPPQAVAPSEPRTTEPQALPGTPSTEAPPSSIPDEGKEAQPAPTEKPSEPGKSSEQSTPPVQTASKKPDESKNGVEKTADLAHSLMNIRITDSRESVIKKHGQPLSESVWNDEEILVYEYKHFTVGFSSRDKVEFVTVHSKEADTGINGLKLGMRTKAAIESLGEPDTNTTYVWTYKSPGAVLKLDIDPKLDTIHSIKLFSN
jgi:hypothetical protein